jgi:glutaminase
VLLFFAAVQESSSFQHGNDPDSPPRRWDANALMETLELYFMSCSIEATCAQMSVVAATLANGGRCPVVPGDKVFEPSEVKNALCLMLSCGMYDYSGQWSYTIGLPAKSGVSGVILTVVPNVGGFATCAYSMLA